MKKIEISRKKRNTTAGFFTLFWGILFVMLRVIAKKKKRDSVYENALEQKNPLEGKKVVFIENTDEEENADGIRGHLEAAGEVHFKPSFYDKYVKRVLDVILSFFGLVILLPVMGVIALAIKIEDPGKVFFIQKRVGQNKKYFKLHKFRTMKTDAPHDIPTHQLVNPEQYITKVGKFLRRHSLDELPQIWDIFIGNMSIVGPRPGLWNQYFLIAERDKYGANEVKPGLTGWAQINGRDELEIPVKAKLDGEYIQKESLWFDARCFFKTVSKIGQDNSVIEGGTGEIKKNRHTYTENQSNDDLIGNIGFAKPVRTDLSGYKKILVVGANSYIGESFKSYAKKHYKDNFSIDTIGTITDEWRNIDFSPYDVIYHVAGIAHADISKVKDSVKEKYYTVNTDLAVDVAEKAKEEGVKVFILMSSMIVYGDLISCKKEKAVGKYTVPVPGGFYGDSKLQADVGVRALADEKFKVIVLRPPIIYGKGSKGNYPVLAKLAQKLPVIPDINNSRSMLYIENLCEFLCQIMLIKEFQENSVVLFPQNSEWTKTCDMIREIAAVYGGKSRKLAVLNPMVYLAMKVPGKIGKLMHKAFGNSCYDHEISNYAGIDYQKVSLTESIRRTEGNGCEDGINVTQSSKPKALILASVASMIDQFNMDNINILLNLGYNVEVAANFVNVGTITRERAEELKKRLQNLKVYVHHIPIPRSVSNVHEIIYSYTFVKKLCNKNQYKIIHCHSPIGGVIARMAARESRKNGTKLIYTAHGFHFYDGAPGKNWLTYYPVEKYCSRFTDVLITINHEDYHRAKAKFHTKKTVYVPGIGIDTKKFNSGFIAVEKKRCELGVKSDEIMIFSVGELSERKNYELVIRAIKQLNNPKIKYFIAGEEELKNYLEHLVEELCLGNKVVLLGYRTDSSELCQAADFLIFPSHQEGLPVALMEAIACKTAVVCSNINGNTDFVMNDKDLFDECSFEDIDRCLKNNIGNRTREELLEYKQKDIVQNYRHLKSIDLSNIGRNTKMLNEDLGEAGCLVQIIKQQKLKKKLGIPLNTVLVFSVGELNDNKNHRTVVEAVAKMQDKSIHYIIAGNGKNKEKLMNLANTLGISSQIHLLGYRNDICELLKVMDIFCLPSLREGLNVSLMEAMASGLPCIVSKTRGNMDLIANGKGGYIVEAEDCMGYKESIEKIRKAKQMMGAVNVETMKNFNNLTVNKIMETIYKE